MVCHCNGPLIVLLLGYAMYLGEDVEHKRYKEIPVLSNSILL
jgi:hypothetical protein